MTRGVHERVVEQAMLTLPTTVVGMTKGGAAVTQTREGIASRCVAGLAVPLTRVEQTTRTPKRSAIRRCKNDGINTITQLPGHTL